MSTHNSSDPCCNHGGARPGCGRKPGVKTKPVRLPEWLLNALEAEGDPRKAIIKACIAHYQLDIPSHCKTKDSND